VRKEADGLTGDEQAALTAIAPLDRWNLERPDAAREWHTAVTCPCCGAAVGYIRICKRRSDRFTMLANSCAIAKEVRYI
jgi:hypothetical protein